MAEKTDGKGVYINDGYQPAGSIEKGYQPSNSGTAQNGYVPTSSGSEPTGPSNPPTSGSAETTSKKE